jgi:hypothetical protein
VHSGTGGKDEKAMRYAHEPDRVRIQRFEATFGGDNGSHRVTLDQDTWRCECHLFEAAGGCVHTLAVQKMLDPMLTDAQRETSLYDHVALGDEEPAEEAVPV